jgi:hypothetical protein
VIEALVKAADPSPDLPDLPDLPFRPGLSFATRFNDYRNSTLERQVIIVGVERRRLARSALRGLSASRGGVITAASA